MTVGASSANIITPYLNALRGTNWTAPTALYVKLHTGDPGSAGTANAAAGSTTRVVATLAAPSGNAVALTGTPPTWTNGGTNETITHISVWDAVTSGNFLFSVLLGAAVPWASGNVTTLNTLTAAAGPAAA